MLCEFERKLFDGPIEKIDFCNALFFSKVNFRTFPYIQAQLYANNPHSKLGFDLQCFYCDVVYKKC